LTSFANREGRNLAEKNWGKVLSESPEKKGKKEGGKRKDPLPPARCRGGRDDHSGKKGGVLSLSGPKRTPGQFRFAQKVRGEGKKGKRGT